MNLLQTYRQVVGAGGRLDEPRARAIIAAAMPHAVATLGLPPATALPVSSIAVAAEAARGGSLIPAWPVRQPNGSVVIEYVDDWGALLAAFVSLTGAEQFDATVLAQRRWIGIANDVLQLFVTDPPPGTYSMVRHHALMLAAATAWLGPTACRTWQIAHRTASTAFVRSSDRPLHEAIEIAEHGLQSLLDDARAHQSASQALIWLDNDPVAGKQYLDFLGAASLGVAAVLQTMPVSDPEQAVWLAHAVKDLHAQPDFNRDWIEEYAFARGGSPA